MNFVVDIVGLCKDKIIFLFDFIKNLDYWYMF